MLRSSPSCCARILLAVICWTSVLTIAIGGVEAGEIAADRLFDPNHLLNVEIEILEEDWKKLCRQTRGRGGFATLFSNTTEKPFTYFKGDIKIDGVKIPAVGIRKKGFIGSLDEVRPSLKIKFDEFVDQQPIDRLDRLTLNNNKQDTALVSQFLAYQVFNDAGVHAPRCNFAKVTVNGEYLGIYSNVESVKKHFLKARYGDDSGNLYEGTLADFYPKSVEKLEAKTNTKPTQDRDVVRLAELLSSENDLPMDEVNVLVDVDSFLKFWAVESLIGFWDGYTQNQNNFFVYDNPVNGKFYFMPWGADSCFTTGGGPFARFGGSNPAASVRAESMLANRLFHTEIVPTRYKQTMLKVLEVAWDEDKLISEVDRIEILTRDQLHANQEVGGNASPWRGRSLTMDGVRAFIRNRREKILSEFEDWPVEVASKPRKPMYTVEVGSASGTLETRWSANANAKRLGNATNLKLKLHGSDVTLHDITVVAHPMQFFGFRGPRGGRAWTPPATIVLTGVRESDKENVTLTLMIDREALSKQPREPVKVSGSLSAGARGRFGFGPPGQMIAGTLDLSSTGTKDGDTIAGNFQLSIVEMHGGMMDRMRRGNRGRPGRPR